VERYQEALHVTRTEPGERDSSQRWTAIEPHVPARGMVLDVGSNLGYFGLRIVAERTQVGVVSLEPSPIIAERQRKLLLEHATTRICLIRGSMDAETARRWAGTCDWFEVTLALSVLHWMDDPAAVLRALSLMSGAVIAEVPDAADAGACGRDNIALWGSDPVVWFHEQTGRHCSLLARPERHTSAVPSHLILVTGPVSRQPRVPYWGYSYSRSEPRDYRIDFDGRQVTLRVRGSEVDYLSGVNLLSLMRLGTLLHPGPAYWRQSAMAALERNPTHGDPYPHNMLWTPDGVVLIDDDDLYVERSRPLALESLERNLAGWGRGRTGPYVREALGPWRLARRFAGRVCRRLIGDQAVERLKGLLGLPR
jgi:SAM-dependent methyltransferase